MTFENTVHLSNAHLIVSMMPVRPSVEVTRRGVYLSIMRRRLQPGQGSSLQFMLARDALNVPDLRQILGTCPFVVVGGVATAFYMPMRATKDIDVLVRDSDAQRTDVALIAAGAERIGPLRIPGPLGLTGQSWRLADGSELVLLLSSQEWANAAVTDSSFDTSGTPVVALPYLVLMKLAASRAVDLGDIERMLGMASSALRDQTRAVIARYLANVLEDYDSMVQLAMLGSGDAGTNTSSTSELGDAIRVREHARQGRVVREHWRRVRPASS